MKLLSVILPAYNEEGNIVRAVERCREVLPPLVKDFEIVAVNDGSSDRTGELLEHLRLQEPRLRVFHHASNRGLGAAIRTGITQAHGDFILNTCADLQFDIAEVKNFLPLARNADIVVGYRTQRKYNIYRNFNTLANHFLLRVLFGLKVRDPNWIKLFRRNVFETVEISSDGFFWDSEVLIKAQRHGYRFAEAPTTMYGRYAGKAAGSNPIRVLRTAGELFFFWIKNLI